MIGLFNLKIITRISSKSDSSFTTSHFFCTSKHIEQRTAHFTHASSPDYTATDSSIAHTHHGRKGSKIQDKARMGEGSQTERV